MDTYKNFMKIIEKYYHQPSVKRIPPQKKTIQKTIVEEVPEKYEEILKPKHPSSKNPFIFIFSFFFIISGIFVIIGHKPEIGVPIILLSIILIIIGLIKKEKVEKITKTRIVKREKIVEEEVEEPEKIIEIPNTKRIVKLKESYIPFWSVPIEDNSLLIGPEAITERIKIKFPTVNDLSELNFTLEEIEKLKEEVPYILTGDKEYFESKKDTPYGNEVALRGYERDFVQYLIDLKNTLENRKQINFNLQILNNDSIENYLEKIKEEIPVDNSVQTIIDYIYSEEGHALENKLTEWLKDWEYNKNVLDYVRITSLSDQVAPIGLDLSDAISYSAFNFYCPNCNKEKITNLLNRDYTLQTNAVNEPVYFSDNTRCIFNPVTKLWKCKSCNQEFAQPIPIHKTFDEILLPTYLRLLDENKNERVKAHRDIKNKEIEYDNQLENELEKITYENITAMLQLTDEMERMKAEIEGEVDAVGSFREIESTYSQKQSMVIENINRFCQTINREIAESTMEIINRVDQIKETEMEQLDQKLTILARAKKREEEVRDMVQRNILGNIMEQTEVMNQGFNQIGQGLDSIQGTMNEGFTNLSGDMNKINSSIQEGAKKLSRANAIQAAIAKKQGINLHDENPALHPLKKAGKVLIDVKGKILGKSTIDIEGEKLNE